MVVFFTIQYLENLSTNSSHAISQSMNISAESNIVEKMHCTMCILLSHTSDTYEIVHWRNLGHWHQSHVIWILYVKIRTIGWKMGFKPFIPSAEARFSVIALSETYKFNLWMLGKIHHFTKRNSTTANVWDWMAS